MQNSSHMYAGLFVLVLYYVEEWSDVVVAMWDSDWLSWARAALDGIYTRVSVNGNLSENGLVCTQFLFVNGEDERVRLWKYPGTCKRSLSQWM